ncbi:tRNA (adenosine(37)-N6)-threonylcarbamoyltransferase complex dimerization subunit type 1 TsaB [bacterium]|nr:tRNA (adenosine(37)-N6)-threonylcarbamoyltransferase complex dimerization subunit type 1 TsaB [bacterium]
MSTLLIDTAHPEASVSVATGDKIVATQSWRSDNALGSALLVAIDDVLAKEGIARSDIECVAVHRGPGHYSALRAGIVTASLLADVLAVPLKHFATNDVTSPTFLKELDRSESVTMVQPQYEALQT